LQGLWRGALSPRIDRELQQLVQADLDGEAPRPLSGLLRRLHELGLDEHEYAKETGLELVPEPSTLAFAGFDRYRRALWLRAGPAQAWRAMRAAAQADAVMLEAISGYRSHDYQLGIFRRKLARGQSVAEILRVNAAPGFSEHHGGRVLDISTPGEPAAEESFEHTPAFAWLQAHAGDFGFEMSYPRGNPHGIDYEPWHWRHEED
jgi:D-alanyl-D-alanine carboxypeptidase